jgi:cytochrome c oxidase assembly protein subunit 15
MFLLPLSKMVSESGVYYEHAHRLFGALVGFTVGALALYLWRFEPERRLRAGAAVAFVAVALQGALGGIRVEAAEAGTDTALSSALRVAHGVAGQLLLAGLLALAAATASDYRTASPLDVPTARNERRFAALLVLASIGQLILGALLRHLSREWLVPHIAGAVVVGGIAILVSVRATGLYPAVPSLRIGGVALMLLVVLQWLLGFLALAVTGPDPRSAATGALEILVATAHQGTGALLLGAATVHLIQVRRRLSPGTANPPAIPAGAAG